ncbi:hypothetical protein [Natronomonas marina]|uniref:hypothetical protein n=1 Tax=Natronomonas marina TaxID=2961939 RepID=UPI0020C9BB22|nr:hypothetical protein [Natronomonas marina]
MGPRVPAWLVGYGVLVGVGFAVLLWRVYTVAPPLEFTILAAYGYVWLAVSIATRVAQFVDGEDELALMFMRGRL